MTERIHLPYDGSDPATEALRYAFETFPDPEVTLLYVVSVPEGYWTAFESEPTELPGYDSAEETGRQILEDATGVADEYDRDVRTEIVAGVPADRIVRWAEDEDVDLIVVGSHGREGISRVLLGSVAEAVVRRAPVPTLVVR